MSGGYWKLPDATAETFRDGWLHTGDMAREDEDGFWFIVDRVKDMIVTGGFNVYPREVEDVVAEHPAVAQVCVIGTPDEKWGEAVTAVVVLRDDAPRDEESVDDDDRRDPGRGQGAQGVGAVAEAGRGRRRAAADRRWASRTRRPCARSSGRAPAARWAESRRERRVKVSATTRRVLGTGTHARP